MSAGFVFSAHMDTGEDLTKKPPDNNDSNGNPNENQTLSFRDMVMGKQKIAPPKPKVDLFAAKLAHVEYYGGNPSAPMVHINDSVFEGLCEPWKDSLVVKLMDKSIGYHTMKDRLTRIWKLSSGFDIMAISNDYYMVKFDLEADRMKVIEGGPWMIFDHYLTVQSWSPEFASPFEKIEKTMVWIRFPGLNLVFYDESILLALASTIGRPIRVDSNTLDVRRGRFARVCVEINLNKPVVGKVWIKGHWYKVEYEGLHRICTSCGCYGHLGRDCKKVVKVASKETSLNIDTTTSVPVSSGTPVSGTVASVSINNGTVDSATVKVSEQIANNQVQPSIPINFSEPLHVAMMSDEERSKHNMKNINEEDLYGDWLMVTRRRGKAKQHGKSTINVADYKGKKDSKFSAQQLKQGDKKGNSQTYQVNNRAPEASLITNLPGFNGSLPSKHYAGYVTVDESHGRNLYYYFVESEGNSSKDPLVLWLNGGPGCSSFDGFVYEHGPFNFEKPKTKGTLPKLQPNPYSWSKVSNIIYLDSPAGVGFSYSKNLSDYKTAGDVKTAFDTHTFLLKWLELYPEFLANPLFIAGESYAGVYIPTLADLLVQGIEAGTKPKFNFKGYLIGNPVTDEVFDGNAIVSFAHGMGLIPNDLFEESTKACNGTFYVVYTDECYNLLEKIHKDIQRLNVYDILEPCYHGGNKTSNSKLPLSFRQLGMTDKSLPIRKRMFGRAWPYRAIVKDGYVPSWPELTSNSDTAPPCIDDEVAMVWLNNDKVRRAIHTVEENVVKGWTLCTDQIKYKHDTGSMIKYHKKLTSKGYRALIYSGDHDMCVPYTGSEAWTRSIGYKIVDEWRPWLANDQIAGYTQGYANNLTFLTIKGSGHTVPEYKPQESLYFYKQFLNGLHV